MKWGVELVALVYVLAVVWQKGYCPCWAPDDALHLAQPLRYLQGDLPFVHEWHPSLMFGVLAMPVVRLALLILGTGTTDGLMLCTLHLASIIWFLGVLACWWRWRKISWGGTLLGMMLFAVWPPWGMCTVAYNDWGLACLMVAVSLYATNRGSRASICFGAGLMYALAVLCCPHLVFLYVIFSAYALWRDRKSWLWVTLGSACPAALVTGWLLIRVSLPRIIEFLPCVMNDPEHPARTVLGLIKESVGRFFFITHDFAWGHAAIILLYFVIAGLLFADRNRVKHATCYGAGLVGLAIGHLAYYCNQPMVSMNVQFIPLALAAGCMAWLTTDILARRVFFYGWMPAAIYGACIGVSSNLGIYSIGFALEAAMIPSAIILLAVMRGKRLLTALIVSLLAFQLIVVNWPACRYHLMSRKARLEDVCSEGVMKGVCKGIDRGLNYEEYLSDTYEMRTSSKVKTVAFLDHSNQWLYLASSKRNGSLSSWTCGVNDTAVDRLEEYWKLNPDKFPDAIFVAAKHKDVATRLTLAHNLEVESKQSGNMILWKRGVR